MTGAALDFAEWRRPLNAECRRKTWLMLRMGLASRARKIFAAVTLRW
jgi:hypothetical protein